MSDTLVLPARLDLSAAEALAQSLRKRLGADMILDAGHVTHMGAMGLQVLLSAARTTRRAGHRFALTNASDRVLDQLSTLGFTPESLAEGRA
ncbi:STAS domain-containing protein [Pseudooceanicola sp. LIPI14-2-Ac024]|uniref:STAS domain-containing protein n=1 Tax=Pseudooceanicola sp. LIPI14-2-Ac024 TaxID=3344875 RepID=UPI0035CF4A79